MSAGGELPGQYIIKGDVLAAVEERRTSALSTTPIKSHFLLGKVAHLFGISEDGTLSATDDLYVREE
jgi:hypothetical protein